MIFDMCAGPLYGERTVFPINGVGKSEYPHAKALSWALTPFTKVNSKWIKA